MEDDSQADHMALDFGMALTTRKGMNSFTAILGNKEKALHVGRHHAAGEQHRQNKQTKKETCNGQEPKVRLGCWISVHACDSERIDHCGKAPTH